MQGGLWGYRLATDLEGRSTRGAVALKGWSLQCRPRTLSPRSVLEAVREKTAARPFELEQVRRTAAQRRA